MHGRDEKCIQKFSWKPKGKIPLQRPKDRYEDNIKMNPRKGGCEYGN